MNDVLTFDKLRECVNAMRAACPPFEPYLTTVEIRMPNTLTLSPAEYVVDIEVEVYDLVPVFDGKPRPGAPFTASEYIVKYRCLLSGAKFEERIRLPEDGER